MHYANIKTADSANGIGVRVTLFVSGCTNHCKGCFQKETWDFNYGEEYTKETEDYIINELSKSYYSGLTILGGEPLEPENQEEICKLVKRVKKELPKKNIWLYTGFKFQHNLTIRKDKQTEFTDEIFRNIDILVDGKFDIDKKNPGILFRGSTNQLIIDMKKTLSSGYIAIHNLTYKKLNLDEMNSVYNEYYERMNGHEI